MMNRPRAQRSPWTHRRPLLPLLLLLLACGPSNDVERPARRRVPPSVAIDSGWSQSPAWIDVYRPERSDPGFNLILYRRRVPLLMDMDGTVVHTWADVRASGRARLLPTGNLAVIGKEGDMAEYDWEGQRVWSYSLADRAAFLHHDFAILDNGNYLLLAHDPAAASDFLIEVDRSGEVVWRWDSHLHLSDDFVRAGKRNNKTHINSVNELPTNRWYERGHEEMRPGNILISARNLNAIYIVSRPQGEVVWRYYDDLDFQHEALMIPDGRAGAGNVLFFNNGYNNLIAFRQSAIVELNPIDRTIAWEFRKRGFYSSTGGIQQSLPNGNVLVTSSQGGRVFELTRDGSIVWQWSPPYLPMRVLRYPFDYSTQLERLGRPAMDAIEARDPNQFVDANLYAFALPHETKRAKDGTTTRMVLRDQNRCQILQLPAEPTLQLGFGRWRRDIDTPYLRSEARFVATVRELDQDTADTLLDRTLGGDEVERFADDQEVVLSHHKVGLEAYGSRVVELCLSLTGAGGGPPPEDFVWEEPSIRAPTRWADLEVDDELDPDALEQQEKQLKALGYIN